MNFTAEYPFLIFDCSIGCAGILCDKQTNYYHV